ncbi:hypothetical protein [Marinobacter sp. F4206]|uniref:hypothetical protein n=1 Tax=Marinobacter sp. F4206 TaxID=2861777 RepID=UPI001C6047AD|nr:hypothetical protein [Marinobacter sp. F4206]MBW4935126.1 hypothetical protein [Marinobacter sp. F4206]
MRHFCTFTAIAFATVTLVGCGPEDSGPTAFNPATDVDLTFSTFDLEDSEQAPDNIDHTRFDDIYRGLEPTDSDGSESAESAAEIRAHIDVFIQATAADDGKSYIRVRNPADLMNQVIASGQVANFQEGRRYMVQRATDGAAGTYNTRENQADIRFTDQEAVLAGLALNDRVWIYPTLDWRYVPSATNDSDAEGKVYRSIQYVSRSVDPEDRDAQPELISALTGSRFSGTSFTAAGYNQPEYATADYLSRSFGSLELRQDFIADKTDTLFIKSPDQQVIDLSRHDSSQSPEATPDCLRVELDYAMQVLRIFSSDGEPATVPAPTEEDPSNTENNPDYCSYQEPAEAKATWSTEAIPERQ